jgi:endonuclease YncB( thermonuclease family)
MIDLMVHESWTFAEKNHPCLDLSQTDRLGVIERDRHGRLVAKVFSPKGGIDIGRRSLSGRVALAYRRYSTDRVAAEDEARKARREIWRGTFVKPWE